MIVSAGCSINNKDTMIEKATVYGAEDARKVAEQKDMLQLQTSLLRVRSVETRLNQNGHPEAAKEYVRSFEQTLREEYPELAKEILE